MMEHVLAYPVHAISYMHILQSLVYTNRSVCTTIKTPIARYAETLPSLYCIQFTVHNAKKSLTFSQMRTIRINDINSHQCMTGFDIEIFFLEWSALDNPARHGKEIRLGFTLTFSRYQMMLTNVCPFACLHCRFPHRVSREPLLHRCSSSISLKCTDAVPQSS
jgi:hypothetical protein